jgi:RNA polymerase sigma-70 factor (ECF subfamily)
MSASSICIDGMNRATLLQSAKAGNRDSFAALIGPYTMSLYRTALRLTSNAADAEDVRQDTILKAMLRLEQFEGTCGEDAEDLHAWLAKIGTNTAIDTIRKRRAGKILSIDEPLGEDRESYGATIRSSEQNPEEQYLRNELRKDLSRAISSLPAELRQVCLLRDVMQYSTQEVADQLRISAIAVRLRLFRAHNRLRADINGQSSRSNQAAQSGFLLRRKRPVRYRRLTRMEVHSSTCGN